MQLTIERSALLRALGHVQSVVERRNTIPILSNVLLSAGRDRLSFAATDLDMEMVDEAEAQVNVEGQITAPAHTLYEIVRKLPDGAEVSLTYSGDDPRLVVAAGRSRFNLPVLPAGDFPVMSTEASGARYTLPKDDLARLIDKTRFAVSTEETRYYLNGLYLHTVADGGIPLLRAVATDGHRLAHCSTEADGISERHEVIVPRKTVLEMQRLLEDSDEPVSIDVAPGQIRFRFGDVELVSKLVEGKFPDFTRVIPTNYTRHFLVGREALQGSLQRAAILTTDKFKGVRLQLAQNQMKISSSNAEQEEAQEEIDIDYGHEALDVGFNVGYLLDVLANVKVDNIQWSVMPDANASALITLPEDDQFKYVVMPMRI
jgi:DNA polymerase-3 subunit beta